MALEIKILAGAESKMFLVDLEKLVNRMEAAISTKGKKDSAIDDESEEDEMPVKKSKKASKSFDDESEDEEPLSTEGEDLEPEDESEDDELPVKKSKKASKSFDDESEDESEDDEAPVKKSKKGKMTEKELNEICRARALRTTRADVLGILKKKFGVKSIQELEPTQYAEVAAAMKAKK